ncbi:MAG: S8 family peptidase [Bacteroidetes bacterium]|nr:S8 family peptidase [Bacteroidota bacterium]
MVKKIYISVLIILVNIYIVNGQEKYIVNSNDSYFIWIKIKPEYMHINSSELFSDSFFVSIKEKYKVVDLATPFKSDVLRSTYKLQYKSSSSLKLLDDLSLLPWVEYAEDCPKFSVLSTPNDSINNQWYFQNIKAQQAWDLIGTHSSKVAVIDDGFKINHIDLQNNIYVNSNEIRGNNIDDDLNGYIDDYKGYDVGEHDTDLSPPIPSLVHGTHIAGIISAATNNNLGIASVSYNLAQLIPIKASNAAGILVNVEEAIEYAILMKADIINMSFGGYDTSNYKTLRTLLLLARDSGIILVAAAGNDGIEKDIYPAAYDFVLAVGSTNRNDYISSLSQYGKFVDIVAPGDSIYSTISTSKNYGYLSGTSMSAAVVTSAIVLVKSINKQFSNQKVLSCLLLQADNIEGVNDSKYIGKIGSGRLNIYQSMLCAKNNNVYTVDKPLDYIDIYPNPSSSEIVFVLDEYYDQEYNISITDASGSCVMNGVLNSKKTKVPVENISNGIYFLSIYNETKQLNKKIIVLR